MKKAIFVLGALMLLLVGCSKSLQSVEADTKKMVEDILDKKNYRTNPTCGSHDYQLLKYNVMHKCDDTHYVGEICVRDVDVDDVCGCKCIIEEYYPVYIKYADDMHAVRVNIDFSKPRAAIDQY